MDRTDMRRLLPFALLLLTSPASHAIFKCTDRGVTVFQDAPCPTGGGEIKVKPASGASQAQGQPPASQQPAAPSASKFDPVASLKRVQGERRVVEIDREIHAAERRVEDARERMDREIAIAKESKNYARNNLAGATWEQSLAMEMQAATSRFQAVSDAENAKIKALKDERQKLTEAK